MAAFNTVPTLGLGGHSVKISFSYNAGSSPTASSGFWLDDLKLTCYAPLSTPPGYEFLRGTSMAAPHVTGAAGLLFSLEPTASVTEVRDALLAGVDDVPSLIGKTVTGGRLDLAKAMDSLEETSSTTPRRRSRSSRRQCRHPEATRTTPRSLGPLRRVTP